MKNLKHLLVNDAIFLTLCLAVPPSFAADCTTTKLANLNGYANFQELPWKTQSVDVGQIFLTKHVCGNGKPYLGIEVHGPYSIETYSLPLEDLEELSELRQPLEKLHSEFEIGPVLASCRITKSESRIDANISRLWMSATTCVDTGYTYLTISVPGGYRRVISVSVFSQEAIDSFLEAVNLVYDELAAFEEAAQKRWEALVEASPVLSLEQQREVLALCTSHLVKRDRTDRRHVVEAALEAKGKILNERELREILAINDSYPKGSKSETVKSALEARYEDTRTG